jgi:predicted metal-dependent peptidase
MDKEAREKVIRARTSLLISNGFFGFLAMQLRLIEATKEMNITTMAVDGFSIFYWPEFVHSLDETECEGVVAHELMHCCYQHFSRRQHRDPTIWNAAGDFVINLDITEADFKLPGHPVTFDMILNPDQYKNLKGHLLDKQFKGMNTETVYDILVSNMIAKGRIIVLGSDPGGCGGVLDAPSEGQKADANQTWETAVRIAVQTAQANSAGKIPGSLRQLITYLNRPKVSWRDMTRRFIDQSLTKETSWSRLSRRSFSTGTLLPGMISDRLQHLVFFVDISGSISFELCREMVSEVAGALNENTADMISVVYADTAVVHVDQFMQGDVVKAGQYRGGGTDFRDSFKWLKENAPDASCVIYLTDLEVNEYGEDPGCPVLWAVYSNRYEHVASQVPFGSCIHISNTYG